ncbi:B12-binding domain-containing radical SAM protein [Patescibacteria group bacterium]|nr:B12-binding domain-containing radical SAM protein [Patescibacteria group bacterium]
MRCLFIYPSWNVWSGYSEGIGILSSLLKQAGHDVKLLYINENFFPFDEEKVKDYVEDYKPGIILFSVVTNQRWVANRIAHSIRTYSSVPLVIGGIHPTSSPEKCLEDFDIVCRGEGEGAVVELVNALEGMKPISSINNLWLREEDRTIRNPLRPFVNLSSLPIGDRTVFDYQKILDIRAGWIDVMAGRGCPRACSYCFNQSYAKLYQQDGHFGYIRMKSPQHIIAEIEDLRGKYKGVNTVTFIDDSLTLNARWLESFCPQYKREVGLPFTVQANPLELTKDVVQLLKDAGCLTIRIGVETANHNTRRQILNRPMSNRQMRNAIERLKGAGIRVYTSSMIGLPGETKDDVLKTIKFNAELGVNIARFLTFYPFRGTPIYDLCIEQGLLDPTSTDEVPGYIAGTILNHSDEFKDFIEDVQARPCDYLNMFCQEKNYKYKLSYAARFPEKVPK